MSITSTKRGRSHTPSPDPETLVRFAELLKLRGLAISTQEEYLRFVRKLTARTGGERRLCKLENDEFMRRYLLHVPPPGQHRVRYFGWMHPAARNRRLKVETILAVVIVVRAKVDEPPPWHLRCPYCEAFALVVVGRMPRAPPACRR